MTKPERWLSIWTRVRCNSARSSTARRVRIREVSVPAGVATAPASRRRAPCEAPRRAHGRSLVEPWASVTSEPEPFAQPRGPTAAILGRPSSHDLEAANRGTIKESGSIDALQSRPIQAPGTGAAHAGSIRASLLLGPSDRPLEVGVPQELPRQPLLRKLHKHNLLSCRPGALHGRQAIRIAGNRDDPVDGPVDGRRRRCRDRAAYRRPSARSAA